MTAAQKFAIARQWYEKGECPGCRAPLRVVAGQGLAHIKPHGRYKSGGSYRIAPAEGYVVGAGAGSMDRCSWTADQLAALVHMGSGLIADSGNLPSPAVDGTPGPGSLTGPPARGETEA